VTNAPANIHVGLHKTGTTFVQDVLEQNSSNLQKYGALFLRRDLFRSEIRSLVDSAAPGDFARLHFACQRLHELSQGFGRIIISEENMLGRLRDLLATPVYPELERRLAKWKTVLEGFDVKIFISTRCYAELASSAFAHLVKIGRAPSKSEMLRINQNVVRSYEGLVLRVVNCLAEAFPNAPLRVWRYEDFRYHNLHYVGKVAGSTIIAANYSIPRSTRSPSALGVRALQRLETINAPQSFRTVVRKLVLSLDVGLDRFSLFDQETRVALDALYQRDMTELQLKFPSVTVVRHPSGAPLV
jgi:hypothetical protein